MDGFESMLMTRCMKNHFTTESFDYFKYGNRVGATKAAGEKFLANPHKLLYDKLSRHSDPEGLVLANLLVNPKVFITDIVSSDGQEIYTEWKGRQSRLTHQLVQDLETNDNWRKMVALSPNGLPHIVSEYIAGRICPETVVIVDAFSKRLDVWKNIDHPLMATVQLRLRKYRPFVKFDKERVKTVMHKLVKS